MILSAYVVFIASYNTGRYTASGGKYPRFVFLERYSSG